jgi:putative hydrolase of the HAD superfamily
MQPKFLYFDLGKVLVHFSFDQMLRQVGAASGIDVETVRTALFDGHLMREHESGRLSPHEFYEVFCKTTGTHADFDTLVAAVSDIFSLNWSIVPIVAQLHQAGHRLGALSNTSETHWRHCLGRYRMLTEFFPIHALSFRIGAVKPEPAIFRAAAELAGVRPEEIFFTDDIAENVAGAKAFGFDAVQYTTTATLAEELRRRGLRWNY